MIFFLYRQSKYSLLKPYNAKNDDYDDKRHF